MGPLGELGALFNPGMRHEIEERESKANRREEEGNARDGDLRIDLASGVAVINIPGKTSADAPGSDGAPGPEGTPEPENAGPASSSSRAPGPSAASSRGSAAPPRRSTSGAVGRTARTGGVRANSATKSETGNRADGETADKSAAPRPASKASRAAR